MAKKTKENISEEIAPMTPETIEAETPTVTVTETEATVEPAPSRSRSWMNERYPDAAWEDDASYEDALATHLAETDAELARYKVSDEFIADLIDRNPRFGEMLQAMSKGMPYEVAHARYFGGDEVSEDEPDWEELKKASDDFLAEKRKTDEEIATRTANLEKSDALLTEFVERNFPTEDEQIDFVEYMRNTLKNISMGDFSEAFFDMMLKAYKHDSDVEDAKEAGAIEARNEKITAKRIKANTETDGLPVGGGSSPIITEEEPEDDSFLGGVLRDYERRRR
jgi:hypothetical protein